MPQEKGQNDLLNTIQITKDRSTRTPQKNSCAPVGLAVPTPLRRLQIFHGYSGQDHVQHCLQTIYK